MLKWLEKIVDMVYGGFWSSHHYWELLTMATFSPVSGLMMIPQYGYNSMFDRGTLAHLRSRKDVQQLHGQVNLEGDKALELLQQCCQVVYTWKVKTTTL